MIGAPQYLRSGRQINGLGLEPRGKENQDSLQHDRTPASLGASIGSNSIPVWTREGKSRRHVIADLGNFPTIALWLIHQRKVFAAEQPCRVMYGLVCDTLTTGQLLLGLINLTDQFVAGRSVVPGAKQAAMSPTANTRLVTRPMRA